MRNAGLIFDRKEKVLDNFSSIVLNHGYSPWWSWKNINFWSTAAVIEDISVIPQYNTSSRHSRLISSFVLEDGFKEKNSKYDLQINRYRDFFYYSDK